MSMKRKFNKFYSLYVIFFSANTQPNPSVINSASLSALTTTDNSNTINGDQMQWPTLYSTIENMSLNEQRTQKSKPIPSSISLQNHDDQTEQQLRSTSSVSARVGNNSLRSEGHGRPSYNQQNNNNFYRQTSVTPRILNSSNNDDQRPIQTPSTYFGSGSNVGRGRPMTGDR
jgi:hypothetical protein